MSVPIWVVCMAPALIIPFWLVGVIVTCISLKWCLERAWREIDIAEFEAKGNEDGND